MSEKELKDKMLDLKMFVRAHKSIIKDINLDLGLGIGAVFIMGKNGVMVVLAIEDIDKDGLNEASTVLRR